MKLDQIIKILWKTPEGIAALKAIKWCNKHFPEMSLAKRLDYCNKFEKKYDKPLNEKYQQLLKQYGVKK